MQRRKRWDVVVLGGANSDYLIRGHKLPSPGETVEGCEFLQAPGGKGANQAVAAARLGARVAFIGKVGNDPRATESARCLKREGIDISYLFRNRRATTGAALVMVDAAGEKQIMTAPGANLNLTMAECNKAAQRIRDCRVLLAQFETPTAVILRAMQLARAAGATVVLDPAPPRKIPKRLLSYVDIIRPNASEACALTGVEVVDRTSATEAARQLFNAGVRSAVAIEAGEDGDLLFARDALHSPISLPRIKVRTVDATGAGDAFAAALAAGLARELPFRVAAPFASAAAALSTTRFGAQPAMPKLREVLALMRRENHAREAAMIANARQECKKNRKSCH